MPLKCPICNSPISKELICSNGHEFSEDGGVIQLFTPEFKSTFSDWLIDFEKVHSNKLEKLDFEHLPQSGLERDYHTWKSREIDIELIKGLLNRSNKSALDIGSWNGWLANWFSKRGLHVTAVDYFRHELDGLKARKFYSNPNWTSIQMDLEKLEIIDEKFDLIVLNRCFPYFTDVDKMLDYCKNHLKPNGVIFISGLNVDTQKPALPNQTLELEETFHKNSNKQFFFKEFKGYTDLGDVKHLSEKGFEVSLYPGFKNKLKKILNRGLVTYYAVYRNKKSRPNRV